VLWSVCCGRLCGRPCVRPSVRSSARTAVRPAVPQSSVWPYLRSYARTPVQPSVPQSSLRSSLGIVVSNAFRRREHEHILERVRGLLETLAYRTKLQRSARARDSVTSIQQLHNNHTIAIQEPIQQFALLPDSNKSCLPRGGRKLLLKLCRESKCCMESLYGLLYGCCMVVPESRARVLF